MENDINKIIRNFENSKYYGYMFFVNYRGEMFDSFDENPGLTSVKGEFRKLLEKNNLSIYKGIQQGGRTDRNVSARNNILYVNIKENIKLADLKYTKIEGMEITKIVKTIPYLEFPNMIKKRFYIYEYPKENIKNSERKILENCKRLSGRLDYSKYTSKKGKMLKNHIRNISVDYKEGKLYFEGDGFLPQQVRIMSNVILNGDFNPLEGNYLTLDRLELEKELENYCFEEVKDIEINGVKRIEKNHYFYIFYVNKLEKGKFIGKKGKNIKKLKGIYNNIVVKEEE